jgi:hypothetical protein
MRGCRNRHIVNEWHGRGSGLPSHAELSSGARFDRCLGLFNARQAATHVVSFSGMVSVVVVSCDLILFRAFWDFLPGLPNHVHPARAGAGCGSERQCGCSKRRTGERCNNRGIYDLASPSDKQMSTPLSLASAMALEPARVRRLSWPDAETKLVWRQGAAGPCRENGQSRYLRKLLVVGAMRSSIIASRTKTRCDPGRRSSCRPNLTCR